MIIKDLIEKLSKYNSDLEVTVAVDMMDYRHVLSVNHVRLNEGKGKYLNIVNIMGLIKLE